MKPYNHCCICGKPLCFLHSNYAACHEHIHLNLGSNASAEYPLIPLFGQPYQIANDAYRYSGRLRVLYHYLHTLAPQHLIQAPAILQEAHSKVTETLDEKMQRGRSNILYRLEQEEDAAWKQGNSYLTLETMAELVKTPPFHPDEPIAKLLDSAFKEIHQQTKTGVDHTKERAMRKYQTRNWIQIDYKKNLLMIDKTWMFDTQFADQAQARQIEELHFAVALEAAVEVNCSLGEMMGDKIQLFNDLLAEASRVGARNITNVKPPAGFATVTSDPAQEKYLSHKCR